MAGSPIPTKPVDVFYGITAVSAKSAIEHPHDKPLSLALQPLVPRPFAEHLQKFIGQTGGINMTLKAICYLLRIWMFKNPKHEMLSSIKGLEESCLEGRMLTGMWRYIDTPSALMSVARTADLSSVKKILSLVVTMLSILFRGYGQVSGDLLYTQKYIAKSWSFPKLQWHYRFSKALAQTFASILDIRTLIKASSSCCGGDAAQTAPSSPLDFEIREQQKRDNERKIRLTVLALLRNVADMIVYYQWIPSYHPNKMVEFSSGALSGLIGVYFIWISCGQVESSSSAEK